MTVETAEIYCAVAAGFAFLSFLGVGVIFSMNIKKLTVFNQFIWSQTQTNQSTRESLKSIREDLCTLGKVQEHDFTVHKTQIETLQDAVRSWDEGSKVAIQELQRKVNLTSTVGRTCNSMLIRIQNLEEKLNVRSPFEIDHSTGDTVCVVSGASVSDTSGVQREESGPHHYQYRYR